MSQNSVISPFCYNTGPPPKYAGGNTMAPGILNNVGLGQSSDNHSNRNNEYSSNISELSELSYFQSNNAAYYRRPMMVELNSPVNDGMDRSGHHNQDDNVNRSLSKKHRYHRHHDHHGHGDHHHHHHHHCNHHRSSNNGRHHKQHRHTNAQLSREKYKQKGKKVVKFEQQRPK